MCVDCVWYQSAHCWLCGHHLVVCVCLCVCRAGDCRTVCPCVTGDCGVHLMCDCPVLGSVIVRMVTVLVVEYVCV